MQQGQSGWPDSNRRFPAPKAGGLPGFPTSRRVRSPEYPVRESNPPLRLERAVSWESLTESIQENGLAPARRRRMGTLTPELKRAVEQAGDSPVRLTDPETNRNYVLVSADVYDRLLEQEERREEG